MLLRCCLRSIGDILVTGNPFMCTYITSEEPLGLLMCFLVDGVSTAGFAGVGVVSLRHRAIAVVEVTFVVC